MGNPKQKWTSEEEEALRAGIDRYGVGKWKLIKGDAEFNKVLHSRSNIDLKDKWRNLSAAAGQGPREKSKNPKTKPSQEAPAAPAVNVQAPAPVLAVTHAAPADRVKDEPAKDTPDVKTGTGVPSGYVDMIYEVLSEEPNGLEASSILAYIEQRAEVPTNFKKTLQARLRKLVQQEKLEKVDNSYRMKNINNSLAETNRSNQKESCPRQPLKTAQIKLGEALEEAAKTAAYKVVEAENSSFLVAEAVKDLELVSKLADDADDFLQLAKEIFETSRHGEIALIT